MEILSAIKPNLRFIGLMYGEQYNGFWYKLLGTIWFVAITIVLLPEVKYIDACIIQHNKRQIYFQVVYFFVNMTDIDKSSDVIIFLTVTTMTTIKILLYRFHKNSYAKLIDNLQQNVNQST